MTSNFGNYNKNEIPTDYTLSINALNPHPLQNEYQCAIYNGVNAASQYLTRAVPINPDKYDVLINDHPINTVATRSENGSIDFSELYGKTMKLNFNNTATRGSTTPFPEFTNQPNPEFTVLIYVPELINITSPAITTTEDAVPVCYYENFIIGWNADLNNENGVMVAIEWLGTMMYGNDHPDIYYRVIDFISEDNGSAVLKTEMFDNITDTALCYLSVARGAIENILIDEEDSYNIIAESHACLPFILVKHLD